ncbi:tyrosine protein phosphatase [Bacillus infantis]|uniref:tyrosine-protein phosphatase n=1 Tax=Bacillus infantis TaxID=324767 RepID=UPI00101BC191|nr:CpsB/CapC family capsule biosynthesis tyrosine phosphatase [Bacillus infantis]RYI28786.1 tyrosine protein phosphatase [Bacillus infantis]
MIDIHCHILPNVDDGADSLEASISMARQAAGEGIRSIIATPHHKNGHYDNTKEQILQYTSSLNEALENAHIPVNVLPGQEIRIYGELLEDYEKGEILTLNDGSKYVFIELPSNHVPRYTEKLLFDIQMNGLTPIIVHPERNAELIEHPDLLYQMVKKGTLTQVTASSVSGYFGKKIKKFSHQLFEANLTHFIASDAHNTSSRGFKMAEAFEEIGSEYGMDMVYLFKENAELLVQGKTVIKEMPSRVKKKKFMGLF